ncbi:MAG TPA: peptidoglycan-binding domain-containing protein [Conexibacter sp.]|nr:peptidoglycan-binding domain-containing protein [Conexibacter sp.]
MRARLVASVALPVAAAGALAAVLAAGGGASGGEEPSSGRRGSEVVERRTLVENATVDGTLGYDDPRPALDRLGGTLTWLPRTGATIRPGERLFAVDGEPVILLDGRVPAWRALTSGDEGADVRQLERNLSAFGYDPGTVDDEYTSATAAAVSDWQESLGVEESGTVELGSVVFLPGARRVAEVSGSLGGSAGSANASWDGGSSGALQTLAIADPGGATTPPAGETTPQQTSTTPPAETTPTTPETTPATPPTTPRTTPTTPRTTPRTTPTTPRTTPTTPHGDGNGSGRGGDGGGGPPAAGGSPQATPSASGGGGGGDGGDPSAGDGGSGGGAGSEVLSTTSTRRVVTADVDAADQGLARVGGRATVELPSGRRVQGRIVAVGTVVTGGDDGGDPGGSGEESEATLPVTIELRSQRGVGRLDQAPVVVELARTTRRDVLAVPVAALVARAGGGYAVRVRSGTATREVAVEPGMFADGYVELTAGGVRAGDRVEVPR